MTNAEYIKSMNNMDLAVFLQRFDCKTCPAKTYLCLCNDRYVNCKKVILNWLKKERKE